MSVLFTSVPSKRLSRTLLSTGSVFFLENIEGWNGSNLTSSDFGTQAFAVFRDAANSVMELMEIDPTTIASASGITITRRGLKFTGDLTTEVSSNKLNWTKNTTIVELGSCSPQDLQYLKEYIDGIAISGSPDASLTAKGIVEIATTAEINADEDFGSTGASVAVRPDQLLASKYGIFIAAAPGMVFEYAFDASAPAGFLLCDGTAYDCDTYPALAVGTKGKFGLGTEVSFTADAGTDALTAVSHGLSAGNIVFVRSTTTLPAGLSANTPYYVINPTTNTFQLSTSSGGSAVNITDAGTGTHYFSNQFRVPDRRGSVGIGAGTRTRTMNFDGASAVDPSTDEITVTSNDWLHTGQAVTLAGSSLPTGLSAGTYYVIRVSSTAVKLATSLANAHADTAVNITADGAGTCTLTQTLTSRTLGGSGGEEAHSINKSEMPLHSHYRNMNSGGNGNSTAAQSATSPKTSVTYSEQENTPINYNTAWPEGANAAMNVMNPYTVMNYIIKT